MRAAIFVTLFLCAAVAAPATAAPTDASPVVSEAERNADGVLVHSVTSQYQSGPTEIRVLLPQQMEADATYRVLYVLPVEAANESRWGDPVEEVRRSGIADRYSLICVFPTFSQLPWYADHPTDAGIRQESHFLKVVVPFIDRTYPVRPGRAGRLLVGFSKSGWGAWSLLLRHPDLFDKAAAWDAPLLLEDISRYGMAPILGTVENFAQYEISGLLTRRREELGPTPRLIHTGYDNFRDHHTRADKRLTELGLPSVFRDGPQRKHHWNSGWLAETVALLAAESEPSSAKPAASQPNIVLFYVDDLGWTDVGYMAAQLDRPGSYYETPHIDRLAREGTVFLDAYANAPNCAPSRACLMSGQYTPRHGIYTVGDPRRGNQRFRRLEPIENRTVLADEFVTVAESLRAAGYATAAMGKWHLGPDPTQQGFDVNIAGREWGSPSGGGYHSPLDYPQLQISQRGTYLTDALTEKAVQFVEEHRDRPFFLYLSHYGVHTPLQAKRPVVDKYRAKPPTPEHNNSVYAAMIESVDDSLGAVVAKLEELGLSERTLVIFTSDNGGFSGATNNAPLRGAKGMLYEGGIRVPFVARWPGVTTPGTVCRTPVIGLDLYPTFLDVANAAAPEGQPLDGLSLLPLLRNPDATLDRNAVFWHFPCYLQGRGDPEGGPFRTTPAGALRAGDWKLIEWFETGRLELYNLRDDLGETRNLAETHPDRLRQLHADLQAWRSRVNAPIPTEPNPRYNQPPAKTR